MAAVAAILFAGIGMALPYIGTVQGVYGTAYGVMVMTKLALFGGLLLFGLHNYRFIDRIGLDPVASIVRLKRSVEVEIGVGITVFFCAASITSLPPAIDLPNDRVTVHEIVERLTPQWPRLTSPAHGDLAIPALQAKLDAEATAARQNAAAEAFVAGGGRTAAAQCGGYCVVGVQSPLGRHTGGADRHCRAGGEVRPSPGAALAAAVPGPGGLPAGALRSGGSGRWAMRV